MAKFISIFVYVLGYATQCPRDASPFELSKMECMHGVAWVNKFQQIPILSVSGSFIYHHIKNLSNSYRNKNNQSISQLYILGYATQCPQDASPFELPD
jgi:hypothetical protein